MLIALLSDAHGNSAALAVCLAKIESLEVERIYFLGDAVGYLPGGDGVLSLLRSHDVLCQLGNHEAMLLGKLPLDESRDRIYQLSIAKRTLSPAHSAWLATWPDHRVVDTEYGTCLLVHGSPRNHLTDYVYPDTDLTMFDGMKHAAVFMGHTHRPFVAGRNGRLITNVGSCGLPRDHGGLLSFAVFDTDENTVVVYRVPFDQRAALESYGAAVAPEVVALAYRREAAVFGKVWESNT